MGQTINDVGGPSPPRAGATPGQVVLGCIRKRVEQASGQLSSMASASVPDLTTLRDGP